MVGSWAQAGRSSIINRRADNKADAALDFKGNPTI